MYKEENQSIKNTFSNTILLSTIYQLLGTNFKTLINPNEVIVWLDALSVVEHTNNAWICLTFTVRLPLYQSAKFF